MTAQPKLTNREIFDRVKAHLLAQGSQARADGAGCAYRGDGDMKCAVGCLIPDDLYTPEIEGLGIFPRLAEATVYDSHREATMRRILTDLGVSPDQYGLLSDLQRVHDVFEPSEWPDALANIESTYFGEV